MIMVAVVAPGMLPFKLEPGEGTVLYSPRESYGRWVMTKGLG